MSDDFDELLDAAVERKTSKPASVDVDVLLGDSVVSLRFTEMDAREWAHAVAANPQRVDAQIDLSYGYNIHGACEYAARTSGSRVVDGGPVPLKPEQWKKLFDQFSGHDLGKVTDAIWGLNEFYPSQRLASAKKAMAGASKRKPSSPAK